MMIMAWLRNLKNAVFAVVALVLGALAIKLKWTAEKYKQKAAESAKDAEESKDVAAGYEAAHTARTKADEAVEEVRAKRKPKAPRRKGLEGQE